MSTIEYNHITYLKIGLPKVEIVRYTKVEQMTQKREQIILHERNEWQRNRFDCLNNYALSVLALLIGDYQDE